MLLKTLSQSECIASYSCCMVTISYVHRAGQKYGIYTLLDMHQDVFSGKFCGEGVPDWAVETGSKEKLWG